MPEDSIPAKIPFVGVGCIVVRDGKLLLVRNRGGLWSTPGGHLDFGESLEECAARETLEETGITVSNVQFVAVTNDVLAETGKHYVTIWMRGEPDDQPGVIADSAEITDMLWCSPDDLPGPLHLFFRNLLEGRRLPEAPPNMPF